MPRNKYPELTVKKILEVSMQLFVEKGFEKTTVLDIVAGMDGMTRGAFYHHFKSKDEVLLALLEDRMGDGELMKFAEGIEAENGLERVRAVMKHALMRNNEDYNADFMKIVLPLLNSPRFLSEHVKGIRETSNFFAPLIEEGMNDGSIRKGNPKLYSEFLFIMVNFWMMPNIFPASMEEMFEKAEMVDQMLETLGFSVLDDEMGEMFEGMLTAVFNESEMPAE